MFMIEYWDCWNTDPAQYPSGVVYGETWAGILVTWIVPAPCYPEPDIGAIIDALRHAR